MQEVISAPVAGPSVRDKDRDSRLQSAKKKLKSYRAKQAQAEKVKRISTSSTGGLAGPSSQLRSSSPTTIVGGVIDQAARKSNSHLNSSSAVDEGAGNSSSAHSSAGVASHARSHSRSASRAGHGRGHSRNGSISFSQSALAQATFTAAIAPSQSLSNHLYSEVPSIPVVRHSTSFVANTASSHTRGHSRSGSRSATGRARPVSFIGGARHEIKVSLIDESIFGGKPKEIPVEQDDVKMGEWNDVDGQIEDESLKTPTMAQQAVFKTAPSTPADAIIDTSNDITPQQPKAHARRASRHARRSSVATKRESMEIMGGLGLLAAMSQAPSSESLSGGNSTNPRRSSHRLSGLQSASVLFMTSPFPASSSEAGPDRRSSVRHSHQRQPSGMNADWQRALQAARENDHDDDRLTALEKLEGKRSAQAPKSPGPSRSRSEVRSDLKDHRHSRQSSVQLPSFDDVHGPEGMDKRASINLIESNLASTSNERPSSIVGARGLAPPVASGGVAAAVALGGGSSPSMPSDAVASSSSVDSIASSTRPMSLFLSTDQLEGLGTLLEEEEEDEEGGSTSPVKEKASFLEQERKRQKEAELEALKQSRRASLTPRPLKLKSRPASLFMGSSLGSIPPSSSLPTLSATASAFEEESLEETEDGADLDLSSQSQTKAIPDNQTGAMEPWSLSSAQQRLADSRGSPSRKALPSLDTKRSWRASLPVAPQGMTLPMISPASSTPSSASVAQVPNTSTPPRQGMRALRLGSSGLSTSTTTTAADLERSTPQHPVPNDSMSSEASVKTTSTGSVSNRRGSIIYNPSSSTPSPLTNNTREDLGYGTPSSSPLVSSNSSGIKGARRSSIQYKPAASSVSANGPLTAASAEIIGAANSAPPAPVSSGVSASAGGVPLPMFEELKSKHQRDVALLDDARKEVARLKHDLGHETERSSREYAELERWSAEEKRGLGTRIEHLETAIAEIVAVRDAREEAFKGEKLQVEEQLKQKAELLEDVEAERDMLQDDVDGWRTRCGDLEKSAQKDRAMLEEEKRQRMNAQSKINELLDLLDRQGIAAPRPRQEYAATDDAIQVDFPVDLVSALRSPALGGASPSANGGYFSPKIAQQDSSAALPPPQAVKLLKDMRQQIFNLAGSLEHERSEHLKAKEEANALRMENARLGNSLQDTSMVNSTFTTSSSEADSPHRHGMGESTFDDETEGLSRSTTLSSVASTPPKTMTPTKDANAQRGSTGNGSGMVGKNRKHVFAYDSSMGSASFGSGSAGTNLSSGMTSEHDHFHQQLDSLSHNKDTQDHLSGPVDVAVEDVQTTQEGDLATLGVKKLQTLDEEEEALTEAEAPGSNALTPIGFAHGHAQTVEDYARDSFDLEAGGDAEVDSIAPSTPALDRRGDGEQTDARQEATSTGDLVEGSHSKSNTQSSASSSSAGSHGPISPYASGEDEQNGRAHDRDAAVDTLDSAFWYGDGHFAEDLYDDEEVEEAGSVGRPEFIREWNFQKALEAIQEKKARAAEYRRERLEVMRRGAEHQQQGQQKSLQERRRRRKPSMEDFFGIMKLDESVSLPALPTPDEALDMPPVYVDQSRDSSQRFSAGSNYDLSPRLSMRIDGPGYGYQQQQQQHRPPVAKSAYVAANRESGNFRPQSSSSFSQEGNRFSQDYYQQFRHPVSAQEQQQAQQAAAQAAAAAASVAAGGGGMLSRVSLTGLTSAFSGLGGYLLSGQGSAVTVAAAATKACTRNDEPEQHYQNNDEDGGSISWTATRRLEEA